MRSVRPKAISPTQAKKTGPQSQTGPYPKELFPKQHLPATQIPEPALNQHKPAKKTRNRIPPPQRERILQKHVAGKSIAEISREENRNRETVAKIVRSDEMREHVNHARERLYGLIDIAIKALLHRLEKENDGQLAYKILVDTSVVPTVAERAQVQKSPESEDEHLVVARLAATLIKGGIQKNRAYGMDTSKEEEYLAKQGIGVDDDGNLVPIERKER